LRIDFLEPANFSFEEDRSLFYLGWEIWTYTGKDNQEQLKNTLKQRFNGDGWAYYEFNYRITVQYCSFDPIDVIFEKHAMNSKKFKITFKSSYFHYKMSSEKQHRELCFMVLSKIGWRKIGFWIREGRRFLIPRHRVQW